MNNYNQNEEILFKKQQKTDCNDERFKIIFPPDVRFLHSYNCLHEHQSVHWTAHEFQPEYDREKFLQAPIILQKINLEFIACLMYGDSFVLDAFNEEILMADLQSIEVKSMFIDQAAREIVHQEIYSKMLQVSSPATDDYNYYRSKKFFQQRLGKFDKFISEENLASYKNDFRFLLFIIMLCENIMFAPMFHSLCYLAITGYAPKLCDANVQVMRDEYLHYKHARGLLLDESTCVFTVKPEKSKLRKIFFNFKKIVIEIIKDIIPANFNTSDNLFNLDISLRHFEYVCFQFLKENSLLDLSVDKIINESPAKTYMILPQNETRINLMESKSTIYLVEEGGKNDYDKIDMNF